MGANNSKWTTMLTSISIQLHCAVALGCFVRLKIVQKHGRMKLHFGGNASWNLPDTTQNKKNINNDCCINEYWRGRERFSISIHMFHLHIWFKQNNKCVWELIIFVNSALKHYRKQYHGWPSTQPGTCTQPCPIVHTAVLPLFTQPCPGRTMSTAVCIYVAGLCASCPAV